MLHARLDEHKCNGSVWHKHVANARVLAILTNLEMHDETPKEPQRALAM